MDTIKITELYETTDFSDANAYLKAGWILLSSAPGKSLQYEEAYNLYALGWPAEKGEVVRPKSASPRTGWWE